MHADAILLHPVLSTTAVCECQHGRVYAGLASASKYYGAHLGAYIEKVDTRLCTLYIDDLVPYAQYTIQLLGMWFFI